MSKQPHGGNLVGYFDSKEIGDLATEAGTTFARDCRSLAELLAQERPRVLPTTYVLTPSGELHAVLTGPQTEASLLKAMGRE